MVTSVSPNVVEKRCGEPDLHQVLLVKMIETMLKIRCPITEFRIHNQGSLHQLNLLSSLPFLSGFMIGQIRFFFRYSQSFILRFQAAGSFLQTCSPALLIFHRHLFQMI